MANQFQGITSGLAELKNLYEGPIVDLFNEELPILRGAEKVKKGWSGYQVVRPLRVRRNQGIGATSDGGTLPAIGRQTTVQATIQSAFNYLRFGVTGPMIKASQSDAGSFVRAAAFELEMGYKDLKSDINRQLSWDGSGDLATLNANVAGSASIVIAGRTSVEPALKFVDVGLVFDIYTSAGVLVQAGITVNSISSGTPESATATLVCNQAVTASSTDVIVRAGSYDQEEDGILKWLDGGTSTINGVDRSLYLSYQGNVVDLAGAALNLDAMQNAENRAMRRGGGKIDALYTDFDSKRFYQKLLTADKRFANTVEGDGGFAKKGQSYLEWNGKPLVEDKDCPRRMFFLDQDSWKNYVLCEMEFADETGSMYIAQTSADQYEVRIRYFANLFCEAPASNAALEDYVSP
jgi:hypothetical protein